MPKNMNLNDYLYGYLPSEYETTNYHFKKTTFSDINMSSKNGMYSERNFVSKLIIISCTSVPTPSEDQINFDTSLNFSHTINMLQTNWSPFGDAIKNRLKYLGDNFRGPSCKLCENHSELSKKLLINPDHKIYQCPLIDKKTRYNASILLEKETEALKKASDLSSKPQNHHRLNLSIKSMFCLKKELDIKEIADDYNRDMNEHALKFFNQLPTSYFFMRHLDFKNETDFLKGQLDVENECKLLVSRGYENPQIFNITNKNQFETGPKICHRPSMIMRSYHHVCIWVNAPEDLLYVYETFLGRKIFQFEPVKSSKHPHPLQDISSIKEPTKETPSLQDITDDKAAMIRCLKSGNNTVWDYVGGYRANEFKKQSENIENAERYKIFKHQKFNFMTPECRKLVWLIKSLCYDREIKNLPTCPDTLRNIYEDIIRTHRSPYTNIKFFNDSDSELCEIHRLRKTIRLTFKISAEPPQGYFHTLTPKIFCHKQLIAEKKQKTIVINYMKPQPRFCTCLYPKTKNGNEIILSTSEPKFRIHKLCPQRNMNEFNFLKNITNNFRELINILINEISNARNYYFNHKYEGLPLDYLHSQIKGINKLIKKTKEKVENTTYSNMDTVIHRIKMLHLRNESHLMMNLSEIRNLLTNLLRMRYLLEYYTSMTNIIDFIYAEPIRVAPLTQLEIQPYFYQENLNLKTPHQILGREVPEPPLFNLDFRQLMNTKPTYEGYLPYRVPDPAPSKHTVEPERKFKIPRDLFQPSAGWEHILLEKRERKDSW